jgi:hypothetical protein
MALKSSLSPIQQFSATLATTGPPGPAGPAGPAGPPGQQQTPWQGPIDAAGFPLTGAAQVGVGTKTPAFVVDVIGDVNVTGNYLANGVPLPLGISRQNILTGINVAETVYQNTDPVTRFVSTCWNLSSNTSAMSFRSDANNPPTTEVGRITDTSPQAETEQLLCPVLPGNYYQLHVLGGTCTNVSWIEYS